jgi:hypothetical protein
MLIRKKGETQSQYCRRMEAFINNTMSKLSDRLDQAKEINEQANLTNPRTSKQYKVEAEQMFLTLAWVEKQLRENNHEGVKDIVQMQLLHLGFNEVDLYMNTCVKDGAYNEKK